MGLTDKQVQEFKTLGYTAAPTFFTAKETAAIRAEVERFQRIGKFNNVATAGDGKTTSTQGRNLQVCPMYMHSTLFRALPFSPKVIDAISRLIGDPVVLHLDQVFLKPAKDGLGTSWHQDNSYFQISNPMKGTAMWIAVHDATIANGTIRVIPGAWSEKLEHSRDPMSNHHIRCYPDESKQVYCELPAGGVAFFCYGTPHATGSNITDKDRAGVAYHFLTEDAIPDSGGKNYFKNPGYHPRLTGPKASGGLTEYGVKVAGTWETEVDKALAETAVA